jgi:hypothetical protein
VVDLVIVQPLNGVSLTGKVFWFKVNNNVMGFFSDWSYNKVVTCYFYGYFQGICWFEKSLLASLYKGRDWPCSLYPPCIKREGLAVHVVSEFEASLASCFKKRV